MRSGRESSGANYSHSCLKTVRCFAPGRIIGEEHLEKVYWLRCCFRLFSCAEYLRPFFSVPPRGVRYSDNHESEGSVCKWWKVKFWARDSRPRDDGAISRWDRKRGGACLRWVAALWRTNSKKPRGHARRLMSWLVFWFFHALSWLQPNH